MCLGHLHREKTGFTALLGRQTTPALLPDLPAFIVAGNVLLPGEHARLTPTTFEEWPAAQG